MILVLARIVGKPAEGAALVERFQRGLDEIAAAVAARNPEVILASWCGRRVNRQAMCTRPGWESISAVRDGCVYEIKSSCIPQPGPAALTDGVRQIYAILARAAGADAAAPAVLAPPIL